MWPFKGKKTIEKVIMQQRNFAAAEYTNLLAGWARERNNINTEIKTQGSALRARARESVKNNDYARKYLSILKTDVVGHAGIRMQARIKNRTGKLDTVANKTIENAFADFSAAVDNTGKLTMIDLQNLLIDNSARDGEYLLREIVGFPNKWGYAIQVLDVAALDEQHNQELKNGNVIRLGIEYDSWGRPVAYHLRQAAQTSGSYVYEGKPRQRIPASEIIHGFRPEFSGQGRGFTWMCAALVEMHHLAHFQEAAIIAARLGASTMGFFTETAPDSFQGDGKTPDGDLLLEAQPGSFRKLPPGVSFEKFESNYPSDMADDFMKRSLKSIASGLNVSYNRLATDPEGTSYGTLRDFSISDRDYFRTLQNWLAESALRRIYSSWLDKAMDGPHLNLVGDKKKYLDIKFQPRGWQWIDPAKDAKAFETLLNNNLTAPSIVAAEQGRDFDEVCQQIAADREKMKHYNILESEVDNGK